MKIVNVCKDDWTNFSFDNARSLQAVGVSCAAVKLNKHLFNYKEEAEVISTSEIAARISDADIVQLFHSDTTFVNECKKQKKRTIVYHAGSYYRDNFTQLNSVFNSFVDKSVIALGEFAGLGAKNEVYIVGAIDTEKFSAIDIVQQRPYLFAHFPSNAKVKGTDKIVQMMTNLHAHESLSVFSYSTSQIDYQKQIDRMKHCHVYIELFNPSLNGRKYGSFGITALEAAAMGKVVVTMNLSSEIYEKNYGKCLLAISNTEKEFANTIISLQFLDIDCMTTMRHLTRQWVIKNHSYKATGEYILKNILS
jgi:glycosyltransferase involved in cell wall biosynthesis